MTTSMVSMMGQELYLEFSDAENVIKVNLSHIISGTLGVIVALFLYYGKFVTLETIDPVLAIASIAVLIGMILMKVLFIKETKNA